MNDDNHKHSASPKGEVEYSAKDYNDNRFNTSNRMRRLNKVETCFVSETLKSVPNEKKLHVDIPCGTGRLSNTLSEFGRRNYLGIDVSEKMLHEARSAHPKLKYLLGDVLDMPVDDDAANIVLCMRLLHHFDSPEERIKILRELARVSSKWVAVSFYRNECLRNISKRLRGKSVSGCPIAVKTFVAEATEAGLAKRKIVYSWFAGGAQTMALLEKIT